MRKPVFPNTVVLFAGATARAAARKSGSGLPSRSPHPKAEPGCRKPGEALPLP
jgi:serine protease inhibitor ecotin